MQIFSPTGSLMFCLSEQLLQSFFAGSDTMQLPWLSLMACKGQEGHRWKFHFIKSCFFLSTAMSQHAALVLLLFPFWRRAIFVVWCYFSGFPPPHHAPPSREHGDTMAIMKSCLLLPHSMGFNGSSGGGSFISLRQQAITRNNRHS